jgi:hypothetical protein
MRRYAEQKTWKGPRTRSAISLVLMVVLITLGGLTAYGETRTELSRITMGGGYGESGRFTVNDSLTRTTGTTPQKSSRYEVTSSKTVTSETTKVKHWEEY